MRTLWHADGVLIHPMLGNEPISGALVPFNNDRAKRLNPELIWKLINWTSRGNTVVLEWETTARIGREPLTLRGVDVMTVRDCKIEREVVYMDTMPIRERIEPQLKRPPLLSVEELKDVAAKAARNNP
jgi:hypothetical protein